MSGCTRGCQGMDLTNQDPSQHPASEKGRFGDATRSNQEPTKFVVMRQVQDQAMKSIHRSKSRSSESMVRHGHGCEGSRHRHTYIPLLAGTGRDDMGLLGPL